MDHNDKLVKEEDIDAPLEEEFEDEFEDEY